MAFLPIELLTVKMNISKNEIINRLINNLEQKTFVFPIGGKQYYGKIYENGFKILRKSIIQNSFRPIIIGNIIENNDETFLEILLRPYLLVLILMCFLISILIIYPLMTFFLLIIEKK
jgi:hypothetical protein